MPSISHLTLEERAALTSGGAFYETKAFAGVPAITMADGPYGLRKQRAAADHIGAAESVPATCFPPACGLAQSWDVDTVLAVGRALGRECRAEDIHVLLGPGVNLKRSPLGGRSFEYWSEDPVLTAALGAAWVRGIQSEGVGASPKHFVANEQETDRQRSSSDIDPRPLRELYLRAFQRIVEEAKPWTIMASYNRLNGVYTAQSRWLLQDVLRKEWGFDGVVVSDWGGITDRVASAKAGLDLAMPSDGGASDAEVVAAVEAGTLAEADVDTLAEHVALLAARTSAVEPLPVYNKADHHDVARAAAAKSIVLLKNRGDVLPLARNAKVAVIGRAAQSPRIQGGGSGSIVPTTVDVPFVEMQNLGGDVAYAPGHGDAADAARLRDEAVLLAKRSDVAVVFLALPEELESEGWDRTDLELPADQIELARAVSAANPRTAVVVSRGGIVRWEPLLGIPALVDAALLGQGGGRAIADVLYGVVNPSGHLTETIPWRLEDTPAYLDFPGEQGHVRYSEGIFVGHRWYDARRIDVVFPFGHGLSYTSFAFGEPEVEEQDGGLRVRVRVSNTGTRAGRAVAQWYVGRAESRFVRPPVELKAFASVELDPGETRETETIIRREDLACWDIDADRWVLEPGSYTVHVGSSSRDLHGAVDVHLDGDVVVPHFTVESTLGELLTDADGAALVGRVLGAMAQATGIGTDVSAEVDPDVFKVMETFPLVRMAAFSDGALSVGQLRGLVGEVNAAIDRREDPSGPSGSATAVTATSSVGTWLDHPAGGALLRAELDRAGVEERALAPMRLFPLQQLVTLSGGRLTQAVVDELVTRANA